MDGTIRVESAEGRGSRFVFTVAFDRAQGRAKRADAAPADAALPPLRVLVVEDNQVNQLVTRRLLEKQGMDVALASNGNEAVEAWEREEFELILMDIQMPLMDGFGATAQIRERERRRGGRIPILALTAHAARGDRERCLAAGMDGYVAKPIEIRALMEAIRAVTSGAAGVAGDRERDAVEPAARG